MLGKLGFLIASRPLKATVLLFLGIFCWGLAFGTGAQAAEVVTDTTEYPPGETVNIDGFTFWSDEAVTLQIINLDGTPLDGEPGELWDVLSGDLGDFQTYWLVPYDNISETLMVRAIGQESGDTATATFLAPKTILNQLQNGTTTSSPEWANGNINGSNSCYSEGNSVPYRYFVKELDGGTGHYYTIQMEWTKGGIHALDYLTNYDATEDSAITLTGGPCGTISTTPPPGCSAPTDSLPLPDPTDSNNYSGTIPSDFFSKVNPGFVLDGPRYLKAYNVTIDSVGQYYFTGTASNLEWNVEVYFTVDTTGSVGVFWGGHLASGTDNAWGIGNGSASVSGAPYHMRTLSLDGGGVAGQDRSIQNGVICLPPDASIVCNSDTLCADTGFTYVCRDTSNANTWTWTVINGTIVGSNTDDSVRFHWDSGTTVTVSVEACDSTGGCPGDFCCSEDTVIHLVVSCIDTCAVTITCPADTTIECDESTDPSSTGMATAIGTCPPYGLDTCECGGGIEVIELQTALPYTGGVVSVEARAANKDGLDTDPYGVDVETFDGTTYIGSSYSGAVAITRIEATGTHAVVSFIVDVDLIGRDKLHASTDYRVSLNGDQNEQRIHTSCSNPIGPPYVFGDFTLLGFTDNEGHVCGPQQQNCSEDCIASITYSDEIIPGSCNQEYTITRTWIAIDSVGNADTCVQTITVQDTVAPVCSIPNDTTIAQCWPTQVCLPVSATDNCDDAVTCQVTSGPGTLSGGNWCYTPSGTGPVTVTIKCQDDCGSTCEQSFTVTFEVNSPPIATCPDPDTFFVYSLDTTICVDGFSCYDPDDNVVSSTINGSPFAGGSYCFTPVEGDNVLTLICTDTCDVADTCQTVIHVVLNGPPVASCAGDTSLLVCDLSEICLPGFGCSDPNGNLVNCDVSLGTLSGDTLCFTPTGSGDYIITVIATDVYGLADTCTSTVTVTVNSTPVADAGPDQSLFLTEPTEICWPVSCSDIDDNLIGCALVEGSGSYDGTNICFTPDTAGSYMFVLEAIDDCVPGRAVGYSHRDTAIITVTYNSPPVATCPGDTSIFLCELSEICIPGFSCSDVDDNLVSCDVSLGTLSGDTVCFTPTGVGVYTITLIATDSLGVADTCATNVTVTVNNPPVATCPLPDTVFVCSLNTSICVDGFGCDDGDNNFDYSTINGSPFGGGQYCFTPVAAGVNTLTLICVDSCEAADTCETFVYVELNSPPVATCPGDTSLFVCDLNPICIPGFGCSDVDGNLVSCVTSLGTLSGDTVCFTPTGTGVYEIILTATDACDSADVCTTQVTVTLNSSPVATCPGDDSMFVCDLSDICIPGFGTSDPDGNITSVTVTGGTLSGDTVCFTPSVGANTITLIVTDSCGVADTCQTTVYVTLNSAPQCSFPSDTTVFQCGPQQICLGISAIDTDGNFSYCVVDSGVGGIVGNTWCFTPSGSGQYAARIRCYDSCGAYCEGTITVTVEQNVTPQLSCPSLIDTFLCDLDTICYTVSIVDPDDGISGVVSPIGSFNNSTSEVCFYADTAGTYVLTLVVSDGCGAADTCVTTVNVDLNESPVASCPDDTSVFLCELEEICIPGFICFDPDTAPEGWLISCEPSIGELRDDTVCFTPTGAGVYEIILTATDACDSVDVCTTQVTVTLNSPPVAACGNDTSIFLCELEEICLPGFSCSDPDNNLASCVPSSGTIQGDNLCFTPTAPGMYEMMVMAIDSCGAWDICTTYVTVTLNSPPVASCPLPDTVFVCSLNTSICVDGFSCDDPDNNFDYSTINGSPFGGGQYCFTPVLGMNQLILECVDSCATVDVCTTFMYVEVNSPPTAYCPAAATLFVCSLNTTICVGGFSCDDPNGNYDTSAVTVNGTPVALQGDSVCFVPQQGDNRIILACIDSCGAVDQCTTIVHIDLNSPPVATCADDDTLFLCNLGEICVPGFYCSDPDGNLASCEVSPGTLDSEAVFFTPVEGSNVIILIATDSCGATHACTTLVMVTLNSPPMAACPLSDTVFACSLNTTICVDGFGCDDQDDNFYYSTINGAPFGGGQYCFTPVAGMNQLILECVDSCAVVDVCTTFVYVELNNPPVATCPDDDTLSVCNLSEICISGFSCYDPDGNLASCMVSPGTLSSGMVCFTPVEGTNTITLTATDSCGISAQCTVNVDVEVVPCGECPNIVIEKTHKTIQGAHEFVSITTEDNPIEMGGFDFLIAYDASALAFMGAEPGQLLDDCGWEYFTYRHGPIGNCGDACPSGLLRIIAIAETNNGPYHPSCFGPPDTDPHELAEMKFLVTDDRTFECTYVPIRFFWTDCGDNSISSKTGDTLWVDEEVFDYVGEDSLPGSVEGPNGVFYWDVTDHYYGWPTYFGMQEDPCMDDPDKRPIRCLNFYNGGIDIACAESLDARGDINLNGVSNEVADAVLFSNYFIYGLGVFHINVDGQIAATDVNADGLVLTVGDLVYQIRIIIGDAQPYPKLAPVEATYVVDQGVVSVDKLMGAALVVVEGDITPTLLAENMDIKYAYNAEDNVTRVLVYSFEGNGFSGEFLNANGNVVSIELGSYEGAVVKTTEIPANFALNQNYPNPFNPTTTISFNMPVASEYTLTVYNVTGQVVTQFAGEVEAGVVSIEWDASDIASGVYFYRLHAGEFTATKKMLLLK